MPTLSFSRADEKKPVSIAKLSVSCGALYGEAATLISPESVRFMFPRALAVSAAKQDGYAGVGEFYQARACQAAKKFGEGIARLEVRTEYGVLTKVVLTEFDDNAACSREMRVKAVSVEFDPGLYSNCEGCVGLDWKCLWSSISLDS